MKTISKTNKGYIVFAAGGYGIGCGAFSKHFYTYEEAMSFAIGEVTNYVIKNSKEFIPYEVKVYYNKSSNESTNDCKKEDIIFYWKNYERTY